MFKKKIERKRAARLEWHPKQNEPHFFFHFNPEKLFGLNLVPQKISNYEYTSRCTFSSYEKLE